MRYKVTAHVAFECAASVRKHHKAHTRNDFLAQAHKFLPAPRRPEQCCSSQPQAALQNCNTALPKGSAAAIVKLLGGQPRLLQNLAHIESFTLAVAKPRRNVAAAQGVRPASNVVTVKGHTQVTAIETYSLQHIAQRLRRCFSRGLQLTARAWRTSWCGLAGASTRLLVPLSCHMRKRQRL